MTSTLMTKDDNWNEHAIPLQVEVDHPDFYEHIRGILFLLPGRMITIKDITGFERSYWLEESRV